MRNLKRKFPLAKILVRQQRKPLARTGQIARNENEMAPFPLLDGVAHLCLNRRGFAREFRGDREGLRVGIDV